MTNGTPFNFLNDTANKVIQKVRYILVISVCKMTLKSLDIKNLFRLLRGIVFLALVIVSAFLVEDVWKHYKSHDTSIKTSRKIMHQFENPVIMLCFHPIAKSSFIEKFNNMTLGDFVGGYVLNNFSTLSWVEFYRQASYRLGYDFNMTYEITEKETNSTQFEEFFTLWSGLCYKITSQFNATKNTYNILRIQFDESLVDLPDIKLFFTSGQ